LNNDEKKEKRIKQITEGNIYPLLVKMAIPSMIGMIVNTVYSMTDTYFVGKMNNTSYTASVGLVFSFISVVQAVGFWFGYGSGNYMSRRLGQKDYKSAEEMAATGVLLAIITGTVAFAAGFIFLKPLAVLLGADVSEELMSATVKYLRITVATIPFMLVSNVLYNQLRLSGSSDCMYGLMAGMALNMLLDPVFILVLKMGVEGAALASLIGQVTGVLVLFALTRKGGNIKVNLRKSKLDIEHLKEIMAGGAPNFCRQGISSISSVLLNQVAGHYGESAIAAFTIALRISYIGYALVIGFGQGFQPICALNYGAKKFERIKKAFIYALITVSIFLVVSVGLMYFNSEFLVLKFTDKVDVKNLAVSILHAQFVIMPFMGYYILCGMFLQNIGKFGKATLVTIAENGMFLIPSVLIMPRLFGLTGLIWCKSTASLCALLLSFIVGISAWKKYLKADG